MTHINLDSAPWVEKHRPSQFENIVLDPLNRQILENIISGTDIPNLLFYGPPGTGKTTTIMNLINSYQLKKGEKQKDLVIHLNASDERGIDIIRNQIGVFVNSSALFHNGMKFVILDEVDYMTKNAQQALRYLLQKHTNTVRFCLICNYISKIEDGLQNEFIRLRFNQLPPSDIISFLKRISLSEKLNLDDKSLESIQVLYKSDIRSMINFMQSNQDVARSDQTIKIKIIGKEVWEDLNSRFIKKESEESIYNYIYGISLTYNIDKKNIIKDYLNFIIRFKSQVITGYFLNFVENLIHSSDTNIHLLMRYFICKLLFFSDKL
jgi:replication factor C subunit 3/5